MSLINTWKAHRIYRPQSLIIFEELLVNFLWYQTGLRGKFRNGLLNMPDDQSSSESIHVHLLKYAVQRYKFFYPHLVKVPGSNPKILEIGPGGLLALGILLESAGYHYSALDAFEGNVFSDRAEKYYDYLKENWCRIVGSLLSRDQTPLIDKDCVIPESIDYYQIPLEKTSITNIDGPYDSIFSFGVFEHLADPKTAIKNCSEIIKPGGIMIHRIDFFPHDFWSEFKNPLEYLSIPKHWYHLMYHGRGAPNRFRANWFEKTFEMYGFEVSVEERDLYGDSVLEIKEKIDPSIEFKDDLDLCTSSATFVCKKI